MDFNIVQSYILKLPEIDTLKRLERVKELIAKYSDGIVEEYLKKIVDARHKKIVAARNEEELKGLDFSLDYYVDSLKKDLKIEKGRPLKRVVNCIGTIYSEYIGNRLYSKEVLEDFNKIFSGYNNFELDEEKGEYVKIDSEIEKLFLQLINKKSFILLNSIGSAVYLVSDTFYKEKKVLMSLADTIYLNQGMGLQDVVAKAGAIPEMVGYINKLSENDYSEKINSDNELIVYSDMFENSSEEIKKIDIESLKELNKKTDVMYVSDRCYINTDSEEIKSVGLHLSKTIEADFDYYILDISKFVGGPEMGIVIADKKHIDKLRQNFLSSVFVPNKETKALFYYTLKTYLEKRSNEIFINKCLSTTYEKLKERNRHFIRKFEREIGKDASDRIEITIMSKKMLKLGDSLPEKYSFEREIICIRPLFANAAEIEKFLRMGDPAVLCWLNNDTLLFNLQLVKEEEEDILIEMLSKKI